MPPATVLCCGLLSTETEAVSKLTIQVRRSQHGSLPFCFVVTLWRKNLASSMSDGPAFSVVLPHAC